MIRPKAICGMLLACLISIQLITTADEPNAPAGLSLYQRSRVETSEGSGRFEPVYKTVDWDPKKTAIIVCDMWDDHYCRGAADRVTEMAPRMNEVLIAARKRGVLIIHSPSGTLDVYKDTPQRKLAQQAPKVDGKAPNGWYKLDPKREAPLPIEDSDPCETGDERRRAYSKQNDAIKIEPGDAITDNAEAYRLLKQRGIENIIIMGVHTNKCVLGRPFGIRQMVTHGMNVVLMRDMTDSMYNPKQKPHVSHVRGTELVVEHIEKYWCPTITSTDFLQRPAFRFKEDKRPHVVVIVSDDHYKADETLPPFAQMLRERYGCHCSVLHGQHEHNIPQIVELQAADVMILYVRRLVLPAEQMAAIRKYLDSGKPLVGLRTASHAFAGKYKNPPNYKTPEGKAEWRGFDPEVLGGNYHNHGPNANGTDVAVAPGTADHPILAGVKPEKWHSTGSLYFVLPLADNVTVLQTGSAKDKKGVHQTEPLTWIRTYKGGRVFFSNLGHWDDFELPQFRKLLVNGIFWAMDRPVPKADAR